MSFPVCTTCNTASATQSPVYSFTLCSANSPACALFHSGTTMSYILIAPSKYIVIAVVLNSCLIRSPLKSVVVMTPVTVLAIVSTHTPSGSWHGIMCVFLSVFGLAFSASMLALSVMSFCVSFAPFFHFCLIKFVYQSAGAMTYLLLFM